MEALDIYTVNVNPTQQRTSGLISRSKEEKEVLEHFSGIVSIMFNRNFTISLSLKTIKILSFFLLVSYDALPKLSRNICDNN